MPPAIGWRSVPPPSHRSAHGHIRGWSVRRWRVVTYVNCYIGNGFVVMPEFGCPRVGALDTPESLPGSEGHRGGHAFDIARRRQHPLHYPTGTRGMGLNDVSDTSWCCRRRSSLLCHEKNIKRVLPRTTNQTTYVMRRNI
jgi:hypothetical protein